MKPPNVTLRLHHYNGEQVTTLAVLKSTHETKDEKTHFIDANYQQTVRDMSRVTIEHHPHQDGIDKALLVAETINPDMLNNRMAFKKESESVPIKVVVAQEENTIRSQTPSIPALDNEAVGSSNSELHVDDTATYTKSHFSFSQSKESGRSDSSFFCCWNNTPRDFPESYQQIWNTAEVGSNKRKIKALLMDYTKEDFLLGSFIGRVISGHWNRHHVDAVSKIIANISSTNYYESADEIVDALNALKPEKGGSLHRRIQFIEQKLEAQLTFQYNF
ncbi:MAG: DUF5617 domain-containing protein [Legionella sp.]